MFCCREGSSLSLTATDMDIAIVESVPASVGAEGSTTAPAHTLYDIVRKLPDGAQVELGKEDDQLELVRSIRFTRRHCQPKISGHVGGDMPHSFDCRFVTPGH